MVEHNATCCPKLYAVMVAAEAFCEEIQEDHPAIDPMRLRALNVAIDTARGIKRSADEGAALAPPPPVAPSEGGCNADPSDTTTMAEIREWRKRGPVAPSPRHALETALREARAELAKHEKCIEENAAEFEKALEQTLDRAEHAEQRVAELERALYEFADNLRLMRQYDSLSQGNQSTCIVDGYALWDKYGHLLTPPPVAPA